MIALVPPNFVIQEVTRSDLVIACIAWGFTLGFGFLMTWAALKQTLQVHGKYGVKRLNSPYVWMIWLELARLGNVQVPKRILGLTTNILLNNFEFYFSIVRLWALQVQFLLQIIINRVSILLVNRKTSYYLKIGIAILITMINISVYCIWIPALLQISETYIHVNDIWDRCEKVLYLVIDAALNFYFIRIVSKRLVGAGLTKYKSLVKFNIIIVFFSLAMDVLIIGMMSLKQTFVYMQFHPLAHIVKLNIEMSMADLIARIAQEPNAPGMSSSAPSGTHSLNSKANTTKIDDKAGPNSFAISSAKHVNSKSDGPD